MIFCGQSDRKNTYPLRQMANLTLLNGVAHRALREHFDGSASKKTTSRPDQAQQGDYQGTLDRHAR